MSAPRGWPTRSAPAPGARFRGRNRAGMFRWGRVCEIVSADPYELVWITVPTPLYPDSSEWRITLAEVDAGTRISQQFRVIRAPKMLALLYARWSRRTATARPPSWRT